MESCIIVFDRVITACDAMKFKDCFSQVSTGYVTYRPSYPPELFSWLASLTPQHNCAWDCACGNGQATLGLAEHFLNVIATDASAAQIKQAPQDASNIKWRVASAEMSGLPANSVDLVTVAQALHWFDLGMFYKEVARVLRPGALLAVWTYGINQVEGDQLNEAIRHFYGHVVGPYWPPERKLVESGYRTLPFPFREMEAPPFVMQAMWTLNQLLGYFRTWSATSRFIAANGIDPVVELENTLTPLWGNPDKPRLVTWPLSIRVGRNQ